MPKDTATRAAAPRAKKEKKDPDAPKKALSSYMLFTQDHRQIVLNENPGIAFGQVGKELGARWKNLSEADKKPYEDKAKAAKARYEQEKAAYDAEKGIAPKKRSKKDDEE